MLPATAGVVLFGAVGSVTSGVLMMLVYAGIGLWLIRPLFDSQLRELRVPPGGLPFVLFLVYAAVLVPLASVPYEAKIELLKIGSYVGAYFAWTELAARNNRWRVILFIPLLLGTFVALYAIVLHAQGSNAVLYLTRDANYGMRASGTFMTPAHLGAYMGTVICLGVALAATPTAGGFMRLFGGYAVVACLPALFLSGSRSGYIGALVGLGVMLFMITARRSRRSLVTSVIVFPLVVAAVGVALWVKSPMFQERVDMGARVAGSAEWRLDVWSDTWEMIQDAPLLGHGPGSFRWIFPQYETWSGYAWTQYTHNEYVHLWSEYGLIGLLLMTLIVVAVLLRSFMLYIRSEMGRDAYLLIGFVGALCAALAHAAFDFNFHVFSLVHLLVLIGAVAMSSFFRTGALKVRSLARPAWAVPGATLILCTMIGAVVSLQAATSAFLVQRAENLPAHIDPFRAGGIYDHARQQYTRAARIDPSNWLPYLGLGDTLRREAFWIRDPEYRTEKGTAALDWYEKALARNPHDMDVVQGAGQTWYLLGDEERALEYMRRTIEQWPSNVYYHKQLGMHLRQMGRDEEALKAFLLARRKGGWTDPVIIDNIRLLTEHGAKP